MRKNWMTLALLAGTAASGAYAGDSGEVAFWLTVLHNNDGESQRLLPLLFSGFQQEFLAMVSTNY